MDRVSQQKKKIPLSMSLKSSIPKTRTIKTIAKKAAKKINIKYMKTFQIKLFNELVWEGLKHI